MILSFMCLLVIWPMEHLSPFRWNLSWFYFLFLRSSTCAGRLGFSLFYCKYPQYPFNKIVISLMKINEDLWRIDGYIEFHVGQIKSHKNLSLFNLFLCYSFLFCYISLFFLFLHEFGVFFLVFFYSSVPFPLLVWQMNYKNVANLIDGWLIRCFSRTYIVSNKIYWICGWANTRRECSGTTEKNELNYLMHML